MFPPDSLKAIWGKQLTSIEFVMDYVQLRFNGPFLTLYVWPVLKHGGKTTRFSQPGYRNELCAAISHSVLTALIEEDERIDIVFDDGVEMHVSLKRENVAALPEAGYFYSSIDPLGDVLVF
jgi:hypothetical protein